MTQQTLEQASDLLIQFELLQLHTLGIDTSCVSDLIDELNARLNPEILED